MTPCNNTNNNNNSSSNNNNNNNNNSNYLCTSNKTYDGNSYNITQFHNQNKQIGDAMQCLEKGCIRQESIGDFGTVQITSMRVTS